MKNQDIANALGIGANVIMAMLQGYSAFKKSNVERFFELLLEDKELRVSSKSVRFEKLLFRIVEEVSSEISEKKIVAWKNLTIKLATGFSESDFVENYCQILHVLTAFDLTILTFVYSTAFKSVYFEKEVIIQFEEKGIEAHMVKHSLKNLANQYLISEESEAGGIIGHGDLSQVLMYQRNEFGKIFLEVISSIK